MTTGGIDTGNGNARITIGGQTYRVLVDTTSASWGRIRVAITSIDVDTIGVEVLGTTLWPMGVTTFSIMGDKIKAGLSATVTGTPISVPFLDVWDTVQPSETYTYRTAPTGYGFGPRLTTTLADEETPTTPEKLLTADMEIVEPVWRPTGQSNVFTVTMRFPGLTGTPELEWSTTPGSYTPPYTTDTAPSDAEWEVVLPLAGAPGSYQLYMRNPASRQPLAVPKIDYAVWEVSATSFLLERRNWLRFRHRPVAGTGAWSPPSDYVTVAPPDPPPGDPSGLNLLRPVPRRAAQNATPTPAAPYYNMYTSPTLWGDGTTAYGDYGGYGPQASHGGWRVGNTILLYGDMHGIHRSDDGGQTWNHSRARGHEGWGATSCAIDPDDATRHIYWGGRLFQETINTMISLSTDNGYTCTNNQIITGCIRDGFNADDRFLTHQLCHWPVLPGQGTPTTRLWRGLGSGTTSFRTTDCNLITSRNSTDNFDGNGGTAWTQATVAGFYGKRCNRLLQSPHARNVLYAAMQDGIYVSTNDGVNWTLLASGMWHDIWEDPLAVGRLLACRLSDGIWHRPPTATPTTISFTQVLNVSNANGMAIGPVYNTNQRVIWVGRREMTDRRFWRNSWTVGTTPSTGNWTTTNHVSYDPADISGHTQFPQAPWFHAFYPSPTNANDCVVPGYGIPWRCTNGVTFYLSGTGYHGENMQGMGFDHTDPAWAAMGISDVYLYETSNYGFSWPEARFGMLDTLPNNPTHNCSLIMRLGPSALYPRRRIGVAGNHLGAGSLQTRNDGAVSWDVRIGNGNTWGFLGASRQNQNLIYADQYRSTNAGDSWGVLGWRVCGISVQNGNQVVGHNGNGTYATSTDAGATWVGWFSTGVPIRIGAFNRFALSPHDWTKCIARGASDDVVFRFGATQITLNLRTAIAAAMGSVPSHWELSGLEWCPLEPRRIYACGNAPGGSMLWRGLLAADYTSCVWTDVTANMPTTIQPPFMKIHPTTGDLFIGKGAGIWCLPPPTGAHADSMWSRLPKPLDAVLYPA